MMVKSLRLFCEKLVHRSTYGVILLVDFVAGNAPNIVKHSRNSVISGLKKGIKSHSTSR